METRPESDNHGGGDQIWVADLAALYQAENLAVAALNQLLERARIRETIDLLELSLKAHTPRADYWGIILESRGYNMSEPVQIPVRLQQMLLKQNVAEKLMFTWLNEFEVRLLDHYESLEATASCGPQGQYFVRVLKEQRELVEKTNNFSQTLTSIMPTIWSF